MPGTFDAVLYGTELACVHSGLWTARYIKDPSPSLCGVHRRKFRMPSPREGEEISRARRERGRIPVFLINAGIRRKKTKSGFALNDRASTARIRAISQTFNDRTSQSIIKIRRADKLFQIGTYR